MILLDEVLIAQLFIKFILFLVSVLPVPY